MQFKVAPSQSRLREFRAISHERTRTHTRTCTHTSVSNFSFPEESPLIQPARRRGCRATGIRRPRGLIRGEIRREPGEKRAPPMEGRYTRDRIVLYYRGIESAKESEIAGGSRVTRNPLVARDWERDGSARLDKEIRAFAGEGIDVKQSRSADDNVTTT